jgi:serine/threonine protein kinase
MIPVAGISALTKLNMKAALRLVHFVVQPLHWFLNRVSFPAFPEYNDPIVTPSLGRSRVMTPPITCVSSSRIREVLEKPADSPERVELDAHLHDCELCRRTLFNVTAEAMRSAKASQSSSESAAPDQTGVNVCDRPTITGASAPAASPNRPRELDFVAAPRDASHLGRLGHYELIRVIGSGGMGTVFKAFDETLHRDVAVKMMSPELAASETARLRFIREARAAAQITHENVVTIHAVDDGQPVPFLVMQLVQGRSLQESIQAGDLKLDEIVRISRETAAGLAAAHAKGLVHRDIKPANILLEQPSGKVKITDFGLARAVDDASLSQSGAIVGTPLYMSPEQARGEALSHRADLFSLGSVMYALCTGKSPFESGNTVAVLMRVCEDAPAPIAAVNPLIPGWLEGIIRKLLAKDPAQRFASATEVADALSARLQPARQNDASTPKTDATMVTVPQTRRSRRPIFIAAGALLLVVGIIVGVAMNQTGKDKSSGRSKPNTGQPTIPGLTDVDDSVPGNTTINVHFPDMGGFFSKQMLPNPNGAMPKTANPFDLLKPSGFPKMNFNFPDEPTESTPKEP